jgi:hypothetical protein
MRHAALRAKTKIAYQTDPNMAKNNPPRDHKKQHLFKKKKLFWTVGEHFCVGSIPNIKGGTPN